MIAVLLITVLFVCISVYFFFRVEKLQRTITSLKRDTAKKHKEHQALSKSMTLMASNTEKSTKNRFKLLLNMTKDQETLDELALIEPVIENYSLIFKECIAKKGRLHSSTRKCFSNQEGDLYKDFFEKIIKKDSKIQRLWNGNNFISFISLVESLLVKFEGKSQSSIAIEDVAKVT